MYAEARKNEKMIRGMMVDLQRRAERRRDYYEKTKKDPLSFLVIHGRSAKIHIDADLVKQAESCMMNWQNESIDRFDGRSQLDFYQEYKPDKHSEPLKNEESRLNYERYRILAQNFHTSITEEEFLKKIEVEEKFKRDRVKERKKKKERAKLAESKAAIGFTYTDSTGQTGGDEQPGKKWDSREFEKTLKQRGNYDSSDDSDGGDAAANAANDTDMKIKVADLNRDTMASCNNAGTFFGMGPNDFTKFMKEDMRQAEELEKLKEIEEEKAQYSGRHCRRERGRFKDRLRAARFAAGDKYAAIPSFGVPFDDKDNEDDYYSDGSSSRSSDREETDEGQIQYISSFGESAPFGSSNNGNSTGHSADQGATGIVCQATTSGIEATVIGPMPAPPNFKANDSPRTRTDRGTGELRRSPVFEHGRSSLPSSSQWNIGDSQGKYRRRQVSSSPSRSRSRSVSQPRRRRQARSPSRSPRNRRVHYRNSKDGDRRQSNRRSRSRSRHRRSRSRSRSRNRRSRSRSRDYRKIQPSSDRRYQQRRRRSSSLSSSSSSSPSSSSSLSSSSTSSLSSTSSSSTSPRHTVSTKKYSRSRSRSRERNNLSISSSSSKSKAKNLEDVKRVEKPPVAEKPVSSGVEAGNANKPKMSVHEIMRLRVQQALNKQCKADKKAEREKRDRQVREENERQEKLAKASEELRRRDEQRRRDELASVMVAMPPVRYSADAGDDALYYQTSKDLAERDDND